MTFLGRFLGRLFCCQEDEFKLPPILESRALMGKSMDLVFLYRRMKHYIPTEDEMEEFYVFEEDLRSAYLATQSVIRTLQERRDNETH